VSFPRFLLIFLALLCLCALPLALVEIPPLVDYPNHLARMHILAEYAGSETLRRFYTVEWRPLPNLAMDLIVPALSRFMPLAVAGKIFLVAVFALLAGGSALLHRVLFGRWSPWPCLAFLFLYNRILIWGFVNFLFGLGLGLCGFAAWIKLRQSPAWIRIAVSSVLALAVYLSHLFAFGAYGLLVASFELGAIFREKNIRIFSRHNAIQLAVAGIQAVIPAALFLLSPAGEGGGRIEFSPFLRKFDLLFNVFDNYSRWFDVTSFLLILGLFFYGWAKRRIAIHPAMFWPLGILVLAQIVMPNKILTASGVDHRMPLVLALVLVGSIGGTELLRRGKLLFTGLFLLLLLRVGVVGAYWHGFEAIYRPALAALSALPQGSRIALGFPPEAVNVPRQGPPLVHLPTLAAFDGAFVPTLFAMGGQQPLAFKPEYRALAAATDSEAIWHYFVTGDAPAPAILSRYDYLVLTAPAAFETASNKGLIPIALQPQFKLYRVAP